LSTPHYQKRVITDGAMAGTDVLTGDWVSLRGMSKISFQAIWTGTPNGAFSFEVTNAKAADTGVPPSTATATALTLPSGFSSGNPAGSASNFMFEFVDMSEAFIRCKYTNASSTGTLQVDAFGKGV
jgi:hypothetical protein